MSLTTALRKAENERINGRTNDQLRRDFDRHVRRATEYLERMRTPNVAERRSLRDLRTLFAYHSDQAALAARLLHARGEQP